MTRLDRIDVKILAHLEKFGRITNYELSGVVGLSPSPCLQRVKRLEKAGLIKRYRAEIDWKRIYGHITVIVEVTLKHHVANQFHEFERLIARVPEVTQCYALCGGCDYALHFTCRDIESYQKISDDLLKGPIAIDKICSYVVMREVKCHQGFPLEEPQGAGTLVASDRPRSEVLVYKQRAASPQQPAPQPAAGAA
jgi:DNA-binding Lrp family transcriptional regulator